MDQARLERSVPLGAIGLEKPRGRDGREAREELELQLPRTQSAHVGVLAIRDQQDWLISKR